MDPKPGYKTTEFWLTLILTMAAAAVPILTYYGVDPEEIDVWYQALIAVAPAVAAGWAVSSYSAARSKVKNGS